MHFLYKYEVKDKTSTSGYSDDLNVVRANKMNVITNATDEGWLKSYTVYSKKIESGRRMRVIKLFLGY